MFATLALYCLNKLFERAAHICRRGSILFTSLHHAGAAACMCCACATSLLGNVIRRAHRTTRRSARRKQETKCVCKFGVLNPHFTYVTCTWPEQGVRLQFVVIYSKSHVRERQRCGSTLRALVVRVAFELCQSNRLRSSWTYVCIDCKLTVLSSTSTVKLLCNLATCFCSLWMFA